MLYDYENCNYHLSFIKYVIHEDMLNRKCKFRICRIECIANTYCHQVQITKNHFVHLTCNYSAALFVVKLRASVETCYIVDLMAVTHRDICHRFSHYIFIFNT